MRKAALSCWVHAVMLIPTSSVHAFQSSSVVHMGRQFGSS